MLSQPSKVKGGGAEKGEEEVAAEKGAERGRAGAQVCCVFPTPDDVSALELSSMGCITSTPLSSGFRLVLVNGQHHQEMKGREEREIRIFIFPDSSLFCHGSASVYIPL